MAVTVVRAFSEAEIDEQDTKMGFAFELVRHGARSPIEDRDLEKFKVEEGILTAEGMRQRNLLGGFNRKRYTEEYQLISPKYIPDEVIMMSTDVNRTIQSGYSELMGLYPPGKSGAELLTKGMAKNIDNPKMLPFKVRDAKTINSQLGFAALPNDFTAMPIFLYMNEDLNDDASTYGCPYINNVGNAREVVPKIWEKYDSWREEIYKPISESVSVSESEEKAADFHTFQMMTDTAVDENFEGIFA